MSVIMGQATVPGNSTVPVLLLPPGTVNTTMWQPTPMSTQVFIGTSVNVSTLNGLGVTPTPFNAESYVTSRGTQIWATTGNATPSSFMYIISSGG